MPDCAAFIATDLGRVVVTWNPARFPRVNRIYLPMSEEKMHAILADYQCVALNLPPLADKLRDYFAGKKVNFSLDDLDFTGLTPFFQTVYRAAFRIPRGAVSTYGALAKAAGSPHASRAVGQAMAKNPLPIVVPCHRVVRGDGHLGGFAGGLEQKRALLQLDGVKINDRLRVET
ncbi:MAG TPA: methylated-DNA--[protein]-cysteine S-methyltransferase [bacterium]|nr:methylated-DNA--[protein]-cysteine S-methyltransferase [bacterium]